MESAPLHTPVSSVEKLSDLAVISTNDEAANSKFSAVMLGYYDDSFLPLLLRRCAKPSHPIATSPSIPGTPPSAGEPSRKTPEINRGHWLRVHSVEQLTEAFLSSVPDPEHNAQILSLGAGYDTLFWRLKAKGLCFKKLVEVDLPEVVVSKCARISQHPQLIPPGLDQEHGITDRYLRSPHYDILSVDLRKRSEVETALLGSHAPSPLVGHPYRRRLSSVGDERNNTPPPSAPSDQLLTPYPPPLDPSLPLLVISECVLIYLSEGASGSLVSWISKTFDKSVFVNYEMIRLSSPFGIQLRENLSSWGCELQSLTSAVDLESQIERFTSRGFTSARAWDMNTIWNSLSPAVRSRVEALEFLDEHELQEQLFEHYCFVVAWKGDKKFSRIGFS